MAAPRIETRHVKRLYVFGVSLGSDENKTAVQAWPGSIETVNPNVFPSSFLTPYSGLPARYGAQEPQRDLFCYMYNFFLNKLSLHFTPIF